MAMCEMCKRDNYKPLEMFVGIDQGIFIGPCCSLKTKCVPVNRPQIHILPAQDDVEYGMEVSNKIGVKAYVAYGGLQVSFERSPREIRAWAEKNGLIPDEKHVG